MRFRLTVAAIAAAAVSGGAGWALAGESPARQPGAKPTADAPTPAQLAARTRLTKELATYGCSCGGHRPPVPAHIP